jgi:hypothetical protein
MPKYYAKSGVEVIPEKWCWIVELADGTIHEQFDSRNGEYNTFDTIQELCNTRNSHPVRLGMVNLETDRVATIDTPEGVKLIHFYDNFIKSGADGKPVTTRIYCFGYQDGSEKKIYSIMPGDFLVEVEPEKITLL